MRAEEFVLRLEGVRKTGQGNWVARCSAHEDRHPSLCIAEGDDGRILLKCFAGCDVHAIVSAVGLEVDALFPDGRLKADFLPAQRRPFPAADVLTALSNELEIIAMIAGDMEERREISETDITRLRLARQRVETGMRQALGLHLRVVRNVQRG